MSWLLVAQRLAAANAHPLHHLRGPDSLGALVCTFSRMAALSDPLVQVGFRHSREADLQIWRMSAWMTQATSVQYANAMPLSDMCCDLRR